MEAQVRAVPRDWYRAVKPAVGNQVVFTTKRTQTPPGRVWGGVGGGRGSRRANERGWVNSQGVTPNRKRASKMADPVKGRAEPVKSDRYKARGAPVVAMRAGCGTKVPVARGLGWELKAQPASREKGTGVATVGA